jgi:cytochrome P450 family 28
MHPPAVFVSRECTNNIILKSEAGESVFIEKDISVWVPIHSIHYDPEFYESPEKFKPERFDGDKVKDFINRGVFLAFGAGPRVCLGRKFATMQSKALIAEVIRNFDISVDPKTEEPLVIDPKEFLNVKRGGLWLNFKKL